MAESAQDTIVVEKLFSGLKFWFSQALPQRAWLVENAILNGATEVHLEKQADVKIWDHMRKNPPADVHSYEFILHSIEKGQLQDLDKYRVGITSRVDRAVGSVVMASKGTRNPFTQADDQILYNWLTPFRERGGRHKGNEIYKQLEAKYPRHTFQSWRDRYIKKVMNMRMSITEHIDIDDVMAKAEPEEENRQPGTKRRKLNEPAPTLRPRGPIRSRNVPLPQKEKLRLNMPVPVINIPPLRLATPRPIPRVSPSADIPEPPSLLAARSSSRSDSFGSEKPPTECRATFAELTHQHGFTKRDAAKLYRGVPPIVFASSDDYKSGWEAFAAENPSHTSEQWIHFFEVAIKPEYIRRNGLHTEDALRKHVVLLMKGNNSHGEEMPDMDDRPESTRSDAIPAEPRKRNEGDQPDTDQGAEDAIEEEDGEHDVETVKAAGYSKGVASFFIRDKPQGASSVPRESTLVGSELAVQGSANGVPRVVPENLRVESPIPEPVSPTETKKSNTANEGRKRASQGTNSQSTQSTQSAVPTSLQPNAEESRADMVSHKATIVPGSESSQMALDRVSQMPVPSQKKRLFGRILDPSQATSEQSQAADGSSLALTASQLATQQPPESGQRPLESASISQDSSSGQQRSLSFTVPESLQPDFQGFDSQIEVQPDKYTEESQKVDLTGDDQSSEHIEAEPSQSRAPSEAESEYIVLDGAPERSQMWISSVDVDSETDKDSDVEELEARPVVPLDTQYAQNGSDSEDEVEVEEESKSESSMELDKYPEASITAAEEKRQTQPTQALWQNTLKDTPSGFGLPEPTEGWSDDEEQLDKQLMEEDSRLDLEPILETTELPDEPENMDAVNAKHQHRNRDDDGGSEDNDEETSNEDDVSTTRDKIDILQSSQARNPAGTNSQQHQSLSSTSLSLSPPSRSPTPLESQQYMQRTEADTSTILQPDSQESLDEWIASMKDLHHNIPGDVIHTLSYVAIYACSKNFPAAELLLQQLVNDHLEYETKRRNALAAHGPRVLKTYTPIQKMSIPQAEKKLPENTRGVWLKIDDADLLSRDGERIQRVEAKHGERGCRRRITFLEETFAASA